MASIEERLKKRNTKKSIKNFVKFVKTVPKKLRDKKAEEERQIIESRNIKFKKKKIKEIDKRMNK